MKRKGIFCLALASVMGLSVVGMAACGNDDTTTPEGPAQQQTTYYQVTLQYESSQGTVTKSDSASSQGYASGETVTVTVTAKSGYELKAYVDDSIGADAALSAVSTL